MLPNLVIVTYNHHVPDYKLSLTLQAITILEHSFQHFQHDKALWEFPTHWQSLDIAERSVSEVAS
jgi:hypothetical protein